MAGNLLTIGALMFLSSVMINDACVALTLEFTSIHSAVSLYLSSKTTTNYHIQVEKNRALHPPLDGWRREETRSCRFFHVLLAT